MFYIVKIKKILILGLSLIGFIPCTASASITAPSINVLAQFPQMTGFRISPDGKHLMGIQSRGDNRNILLWKLEDFSGKPVVIGSSNMQIASARFVKNDVIAVDLIQPYDARFEELTKTFVVKTMFTDLEGKVWREPLQSQASSRTEMDEKLRAISRPSVLSTMPNDPDHVIMRSDGLGRDGDVFRYNVRTGEATRIMRLADRDLGVYVDKHGQLLAKTRSGSDGKGVFIALDFRNPETGNWEEHFRNYVKDRDIVELVWASSKSGKTIVRSNVGREFTALYEYDQKNRKLLTPIFEHQFFDAEGIKSNSEMDQDTDNIAGFVYSGL